jgi:hypothetical protein
MNQTDVTKRGAGRPRVYADHVLSKVELAQRGYERRQTIGFRLKGIAVESGESNLISIRSTKPKIAFCIDIDQATNIVTELTAVIKNAAQSGAIA